MVMTPTSWDRFDLSGQTALITGGGGLLGPEHGAGLARCGARIVLVDVNPAGLERSRARVLEQVPGAEIRTDTVDITDEAALLALCGALESTGTPVEILVNNAAVNPAMDKHAGGLTGTVEDYDMAAWDRELKVGITGTFLCCKVFGAAMARRGHGVIINIASDLAIIAPDHRLYVESGRMDDVRNFKPIGYPVVKAAMLGLSRYLATYWAHKGVRVNCLLPGGVRTADVPDYLVRNMEYRVPLGRWADRTDYQGAVAFLASSASAFMTGQLLVIDGGRSAW